jgi:hypothetical protein
LARCDAVQHGQGHAAAFGIGGGAQASAENRMAAALARRSAARTVIINPPSLPQALRQLEAI